MAQMTGQDSPSLPSIWHNIPEGACVEELESPSPKLGVDWWLTSQAGGAGEGTMRQRWASAGSMISVSQA